MVGTLVSSNDYPNSITDGCSTKSFTDGHIIYYNIEQPWGSCIVTYSGNDVGSPKGGICPGTAINDLVLISAAANYNGTVFSITQSTQWIAL